MSTEYASISEIAAYCENWAELLESDTESDTEAYKVYCDNTCNVETVDNFRDSFRGYYEDGEEFAAELVGDSVDVDSLPELIRYAIDYLSVWRDLSPYFWGARTSNGLAIFSAH